MTLIGLIKNTSQGKNKDLIGDIVELKLTPEMGAYSTICYREVEPNDDNIMYRLTRGLSTRDKMDQTMRYRGLLHDVKNIEVLGVLDE